MTSTTLTDAEVENIVSKLVYAHELGVGALREALPYEVKEGFRGYTDKFYDVANVGTPMESKFLQATKEVKAKITEHSVAVAWYRLNIALPYAEVQAALDTPLSEGLRSRTMTAIGRQMARQEAAFIFKGSTSPSINGLFAAAGATSTYTTTTWGTTKGPMLTVQDMISNMTSKFGPPFDLFISENLWPYLVLRNSTASVTEWEAVQGVLNPASVGVTPQIDSPVQGGAGNVYVLSHGTNTHNTIYPLPAATSNDGVALAVKSHPDNFQVVIHQPLTTIIDPNLNVRSMTYDGTIFFAISLRIWDSDAIVAHKTVDIS